MLYTTSLQEEIDLIQKGIMTSGPESRIRNYASEEIDLIQKGIMTFLSLRSLPVLGKEEIDLIQKGIMTGRLSMRFKSALT